MWDLILSEDQAMISASVEKFLREELPVARLRPNATSPDREATFRTVAELGWLGLGLAEAKGGAGLGPVEEVLVQRLCGRHLASPSLLATAVAAHLADAAGDDELASFLAAGERRAALAVRTSTEAAYAFDLAEDDLLLVWDETDAGLFDQHRFTDSVREPGLDDSLTLHRGRLSGAPICRVNGAAASDIARRAELLLSASLAGLADGACSLAVEYAKVRKQFGKPIGAFQAIKHRCADMYVRAEKAGYLVGLASLRLAARANDAALQVASAKLKAAEAAHENGRAVIQVHGGLGFQAECDAHCFMKRAHVYDQVGGDMRAQAARVFAAPSPLW